MTKLYVVTNIKLGLVVGVFDSLSSAQNTFANRLNLPTELPHTYRIEEMADGLNKRHDYYEANDSWINIYDEFGRNEWVWEQC